MKNIRGVIDRNDYQYVLKRFGEPLFGIPAPIEKRKINPHVSKFLYENGRMIRVFHVKPIYYATPQMTWRPLYEVASYYGNKKGMVLRGDWENYVSFEYIVWYLKRQELLKGRGITLEYPINYGSLKLDSLKIPLLMNPTLTAFPDPDPETTTVDGTVWRNVEPGGESWGTIRTGTATNSGDSATTLAQIYIRSNGSTDLWDFMGRAITLFDTSPIADTDTIDSSTYSIYNGATAISDNFNLAVSMVTTTPASNTSLATGDMTNFGTTKQATDIDLTGISSNAYFDFTLNATGLTNISKTGVSKFGFRFDKDNDNSAPTWAASTNGGWPSGTLSSADATGTSEDPKLVVNSTSVGSVINRLLLMGIGT